MYVAGTFGSPLNEEENAPFCSNTNRDNEKDKNKDKDDDNDKDEDEDEDKGKYIYDNRDIIEDLDRYELYLFINNCKRILLCHVSSFSSKNNVFLSIFKFIICSLYLTTYNIL